MKKVLFAIFAVILLIGLAACSKSPTTTPSVTTPTETETTGNFTEEPIETTSPLVSYTIYIPNDNANGFVTETIRTEDISAETVLTELKKRNVLPNAVSIHSFYMENGLITIDFDSSLC